MEFKSINFDQENFQSALRLAIDEIDSEGEPVVLHQNGKTIAALVSAEDLEILQELEELENRFYFEKAEEAMKEPEDIAWEDIKAELGL
jgi:PHD/YefM family antitoxin component YafN of YafNO toxin-antitoxin module